MKKGPALKVVASTRQSPPEPLSGPVTLVVTTDPPLFEPSLKGHLGHRVLVFDQGDAALTRLQDLAARVDQFVADFRALPDRWTGQKFLKYIRDRREFDGVQVWLMADHWQLPQEQWIVKCGAQGFIKRKPDVLAAKVLGRGGQRGSPESDRSGPDSIVTAAGDPWMEEVNHVFKRFAGALGARLLTMQALEAMESRGQGDRHFYLTDLSSRLMNPGRQSEFLAALKQAGLVE
ncbi:MAG: hypothetical protein KGI91_14740 [Burkholderiales bacterium]|nr:hypothetical protein [Burkholderiales bacterium]MDE2432370.1 hypothetical protein [Burkholderiales bacterium]